MNLLDPEYLKPDVLRRAFELYCDGLHPASAPYIWEEDTHDIGLDGRFNLSLLGRYIEEAFRLDQIAKLKPTAHAGEIESILLGYCAEPRSCLEEARFIAAVKGALALAPHEVRLVVRVLKAPLQRDSVSSAARRISSARAGLCVGIPVAEG